ncbi:MAG: carboxypeptidase regulatory-like domain-containing protein, partial [Clostridia bacterium]|nr:carboxypeptidase regulatory-like domain-containing protein [Clostridia bacterium]
EAGAEAGDFRKGTFSFILEELLPDTDYVFRAKATNNAGSVITSPEVTFTTRYVRETVYKMKEEGSNSLQIIAVLKDNYKLPIEEAISCMIFAGFSPDETVSACKDTNYPEMNNYQKVGSALKSQEVALPAMIDILRTHYSSIFYGSHSVKNLKEALLDMEFNLDDVIKELLSTFEINMSDMPVELDISREELNEVLIRIYGVQRFAGLYWNDYVYEKDESPSSHLKPLTIIFHTYTELTLEDIGIILQKVYPALNASEWLSSLRNDFTMKEIAGALNSTLSADVFTIADYLYTNYLDKDKEEVDSVLLDEWIHDAPTMVQVFWKFRSKDELPGLIASHLKEKFDIVSPIEAAQLMYTTNIEEDNKYTKLQLTEIIGKAYKIENAYYLIGVLKELGWSAEDIGNTMDKYSKIPIPDGKTWMEVWFPEYKNQGFTSVDAGNWFKVSQYSGGGDAQALLFLKKYEYSLQEIAVMLKDVYILSSEEAYNALVYYSDTYSPQWTEGEITETINKLYDVNLIEKEINELKAEGITAIEIAERIKNKYGKHDPYEIAGYLIPLNYTTEVVLTALAKNFTTLSELQFMQMLNNVLTVKYEKNPKDYIDSNLNLFEDNIRPFSHAKDCITLLHNLGFNLNDVTSVLKNRYEMTALDAGQLLVNKNSYGVFYSPADVAEAIKEIYNEDFVLLTMKDYKNREYAPQIQRLEEDFLINTPVAVASCLKDAGYTMAEVFEELDMYYFKASEHSFADALEGLTQIYQNVYPEEPFTTKQLLSLMGYNNVADPVTLLPEAGFSRTQIVQILKGEYGLSVPEVINLYKNYFSLYTMASIENVWSKNEILSSIHDKIDQGYTLDDIHTLLQSYSESELESLNSYLEDAGFELDKMIEMMLNKQQHDYKAFYNVLQNVYDDVDVVSEYAKNLREKGENATLCYHYVGSDFGLQDVKLLARGLKEAGYSDDEILIGIEENVRYQAISALRGLYDSETASQLLGRMKLTYLTKMYRVEDLMNGILSEFPEIKYVEAIQAINKTKFYGDDTSRDIYVWLYSFGDSIPKDQKGDVAGILGSKNPEDLLLDRIDGSRALKAMGYNGVDTTLWMRHDNYTDVDIFAAINAEFGSNLYYYRDTMNILHKAGFNIDELASTLISYEEKLYWGTIYALLGLKYSIPEVLNALIKLGADPEDMIVSLQGYRRTRFRDKVEFPEAWSFIDSHHDYEESDLYLTYIASWVRDAVLLLPEEQRKDINIISETADALYRINRAILVQETFDTMYHIASLECEKWNLKIPQKDIILISEFIDLINSVISIGTGKTQDILTEVTTVSALRSAGYKTDEMTYILKEKGEDWLMNIAKQALGGYNVEDAWHAVMDIPAYRVQLGVSVLWNIFTKSFDVATWIKIVKFVVEKHELLIKIGSMAIDAVSFSAPEPSIEPVLLKGAFIQMMEEEIDLSGIKIFYGAEQIVTVGGPVTTGIGKSAVMAVKKPNAQGESQKDISLYGLSDQKILSMLDFFGSTEIFSEAEDGDNLRWRYLSQGTPGAYAIHICVEGGHLFQQEALFPPITGSVNITGRAKVGQTLSADISGIINASGALVYQWNRSGKPIAEAATSTYVLTKDDIGYGISVTVTANGVDAWGSITSEETERVTISSGTLIGNVKNNVLYNDQIGLSGATVRLSLGEITYTTVTDAEGSYKFTNVPVGDGYAVTVSMENYGVETRLVRPIEEDKVTDAQTIYLSKTLYNIEIIRPTFGGSISCDPPKASVGTLITINIYPRDGYQLKAGSLKYNDGVEDHIVSGNTFTMPAANVTVTAEFEQIPPGSISGIVTDETGPIAQAPVTVTANGKEYYVVTDDDGSYTIDNLPHGAERGILVSKDGYYEGYATRIYITSGETVNVNIVLEKIPLGSYSVIVKASPPEGG